MKLSDKLIELRKEKGWSQEDFAEKLDVSRQAISRWENGTALPDAQNLLRISRLFNVTVDYLLNDDYEDRVELPANEAVTEASGPLLPKKKRSHRHLIFAIALAVLVACSTIVIIKIVNDSQGSGHFHTEFRSKKENEIAPTCISEGSYDEVIYCVECDKEVLRTTKSIARIAHDLSTIVKKNEVAPTCTSEGGYDEVVYCSACEGVILRTHRAMEKIAHQFQDKKCVACGEAQPSEGFLYMSNGDGTCFLDIGDCKDEHIVIPTHSPAGDKVTQIKAYAFAGKDHLKSVRIPETVTFIGEGAFRNCINLESVILPDNIKSIESYTFDGCKKLKEITIPSGVSYIGAEAFAGCVACESIVIPASVTVIGKFAFRNFSGGEGSVMFEIYGGWKLYDDSDNWVNDADFKNSMYTPTSYITIRFCGYTWKRI